MRSRSVHEDESVRRSVDKIQAIKANGFSEDDIAEISDALFLLLPEASRLTSLFQEWVILDQKERDEVDSHMKLLSSSLRVFLYKSLVRALSRWEHVQDTEGAPGCEPGIVSFSGFTQLEDEMVSVMRSMETVVRRLRDTHDTQYGAGTTRRYSRERLRRSSRSRIQSVEQDGNGVPFDASLFSSETLDLAFQGTTVTDNSDVTNDPPSASTPPSNDVTGTTTNRIVVNHNNASESKSDVCPEKDTSPPTTRICTKKMRFISSKKSIFTHTGDTCDTKERSSGDKDFTFNDARDDFSDKENSLLDSGWDTDTVPITVITKSIGDVTKLDPIPFDDSNFVKGGNQFSDESLFFKENLHLDNLACTVSDISSDTDDELSEKETDTASVAADDVLGTVFPGERGDVSSDIDEQLSDKESIGWDMKEFPDSAKEDSDDTYSEFIDDDTNEDYLQRVTRRDLAVTMKGEGVRVPDVGLADGMFECEIESRRVSFCDNASARRDSRGREPGECAPESRINTANYLDNGGENIFAEAEADSGYRTD